MRDQVTKQGAMRSAIYRTLRKRQGHKAHRIHAGGRTCSAGLLLASLIGLPWVSLSAQELDGSGVRGIAQVAAFKSSPIVLEPLEYRYHSFSEIYGLLDTWQKKGGNSVRWIEVAKGVPAIEFGSGDLDARPLEDRRTVLLIGGMDGESVAGGEAVLHACHKLLSNLEHVRSDLTVIAIPWAAPQVLKQVDMGQVSIGRDLDGDGLVLEMLLEDPNGPWTPSEDQRFLVPARHGDAPRFERRVEGHFENTSTSPLMVDDAFPAIGQAPRVDIPKEMPLAESLADLLLNRPMASVVVMQGNHGGVATPGAGAETDWNRTPDAAMFDRIGRAFAEATERPCVSVQPLSKVRNNQRAGSFIDWCYSVPGVAAFELAPWGCNVQADLVDHSDLISERQDPWTAKPQLTGVDREWALWLDDVQGGLGFMEWRPVERGEGPTCWVGGWKPKTFTNPPEEALKSALHGMDEFIWQLLERQPQVELCDVSVVRDGDLCTVRARLRCSGNLPLRTQVFGRWEGNPVDAAPWLALQLPPNAKRLAGPSKQSFPSLEPGSKTRVIEWLLYAPGGIRLKMEFGLSKGTLGGKELTL